MERSAAWPVLVACLVVACGPSAGREDGGAGDAGSRPDADGGPLPDAEGVDARSDAGDAGGATTPAIPGARCEPSERVGLVQLSGSAGSFFAAVSLNDKPPPELGDPQLTDASCAFYDASGMQCSCGAGQVCAFDGTCTTPAMPAGHVRLVVGAAGEEQVIEGPGSAGQALTLPGTAFTVELSGLGQVVTLGETTVPDLLTGVEGRISGTLDAPTAVDITWDPPVGGAEVFTHIPINHHVGSPTFTECVVDASAGALHVGEAMLVPLAVATGLEFQNITHARFAAAETPIGCVEIQLFTIHYVSPG